MGKTPKSDRPPSFRIGITYNLKRYAASDLPDDDAEYDDDKTILAIKSALESDNCKVELFEASEELPVKLASHPVDIVFNIAEGINGRSREAQVPAILDFFQIPFTGSDATTLCIALDKALTKRILGSYHVRSPKYQVVSKEMPQLKGRFACPAIVKPNAEGSSKGISNLSFVSDMPELQQLLSRNIDLYKQDMLVEEYIDGREFTVGIIGNGRDIRVFSPMEIIYVDQTNPCKIYSYEVKKEYQKHIRYECPAAISQDVQNEMEDTARKIYKVLDCKDMARIDFRLSTKGCLYFIEINPLPGLAPGYSDFPMIAKCHGMDYPSLIRNILGSALKRYNLNFYI